ncbi:hypothetical protein ACLK1S_05095 [Escherichia coli]
MQEQTEQTDNGVVLLLKCVAGKIFAVAVKISLQVRLFSGGNSPQLPLHLAYCFTRDCRSSMVIRKVRVALFLPLTNSIARSATGRWPIHHTNRLAYTGRHSWDAR